MATRDQWSTGSEDSNDVSHRTHILAASDNRRGWGVYGDAITAVLPVVLRGKMHVRFRT